MTRNRRQALLLTLAIACATSSGCMVFTGFLAVILDSAKFFVTTPLIPVSPYFSEMIEDAYHEEERYDRVPVLDPIEGENAPLYCLDPPSEDEVMRSLPDKASGGYAFLAETTRNNVKIVVELIVDRVDPCRFFPMVGPAKLHHCHYKATVYYNKTIRSHWPVPFTNVDATKDVVYVDHDHLICCAGPPTPR
jgi:hypothetical protein